MGDIRAEDVEWAVVNRLRAILRRSARAKFNVTQAFGIFTAILLWVKNRAWVKLPLGNPLAAPGPDLAAAQARAQLNAVNISQEPWCLSLVRPGARDEPINEAVGELSAEEFFKWLRDAIAHGDGRTITPISGRSPTTGRTWLVGFRVEFPKKKGAVERYVVELFKDDLLRLGDQLAHMFCRSLSGEAEFVEIDVATRRLEEGRVDEKLRQLRRQG